MNIENRVTILSKGINAMDVGKSIFCPGINNSDLCSDLSAKKMGCFKCNAIEIINTRDVKVRVRRGKIVRVE